MNGDAAAPKTPDFTNPPLTEVVCGVQFAPVVGWLTGHYGLFWDRIRAEYPHSEDHPPLPRIKIEEFETPDELNVSLLPPLRRVFFTTDPGNYLIQLQPTRFLHNWRKVTASDDYPRFPEAYSRFARQWSEFNTYLTDVQLPAPKVQAYELTYVNMMGSAGMKFPRDVWRFMNFYNKLPQTASGADPRVITLTLGWPFGEGAGQLAMTLKHGVKAAEPQGTPDEVLLVEFTARGTAEKGGATMNQWFSTAHHAIVYTFAALTTDESHAMWGRVA